MGETITKTFVTKNAIIRIHQPVLTEEERAKRMAAIEKAAIDLIRSYRRQEALRRQKEQEASQPA